LIPASTVSWGLLAQTLNQGYCDYPVPIHTTPAQLQRIVAAWDIDLNESVAALASDGELVGIGLLGVRGRRGWVSGLAVVPAWRRRGLGRMLLSRLIEAAQIRGLEHITLEVLTGNAPAMALYQSAGFHVRRELLSWERPPENGALPVPVPCAEPADPYVLVAEFDAWHGKRPCWQQELRSLQPGLDQFDGWVMMDEGRPAAYALTLEQGRQIALMDVGVAPGASARVAARPLLQTIQLRHMDATLTLANLPSRDPLNHVLAALGFRVNLRQHEMVLELSAVSSQQMADG